MKEFQTAAQTFVKQKLPELLRTYIDSGKLFMLFGIYLWLLYMTEQVFLAINNIFTS